MQAIDFMVKVVTKEGEIELESALFVPIQAKSIVCIITHPYSLWGGSMDNNVVVGVRKELLTANYPCVTFNFRGVGKSSGVMGKGIEEQEDLIAVCDFCLNTLKFSQIFIVGYSFGGLVSLAASDRLKNIKGMALISYPSGFLDTIEPKYDSGFPILLIHGEQDNLIPISQIHRLIPNFSSPITLKTIPTDHFYAGREKQVGEIIRNFVDGLEI